MLLSDGTDREESGDASFFGKNLQSSVGVLFNAADIRMVAFSFAAGRKRRDLIIVLEIDCESILHSTISILSQREEVARKTSLVKTRTGGRHTDLDKHEHCQRRRCRSDASSVSLLILGTYIITPSMWLWLATSKGDSTVQLKLGS